MEIIRDTSADSINNQLYYLDQFPKNCFVWIQEKATWNRGRWVVRYARFWSVYDSGRYCGFVATTDHGKGRWVFHFGSVPDFRKSIIAPIWRLFLKEAQNDGCKMVSVYIPDNRNDIRKLARIFKFRQFSSQLWVYHLQKHQKYSQFPSQRQLSAK